MLDDPRMQTVANTQVILCKHGKVSEYAHIRACTCVFKSTARACARISTQLSVNFLTDIVIHINNALRHMQYRHELTQAALPSRGGRNKRDARTLQP